MNRLRKRRARRLGPQPTGWGVEQLEQRAAKARQIMVKFDLMPPEYRSLANDYGMRVRTMMAEGMKPDQIKREMSRA